MLIVNTLQSLQGSLSVHNSIKRFFQLPGPGGEIILQKVGDVLTVSSFC